MADIAYRMRLVLGMVLAGLGSGLAHAQEHSRAQPGTLAECVQISDGARRLACYDRVARGEDAPPQQQGTAGVEAQWAANGMTTTRPFRVSGPWEMQWETSGALFQIYMYRAGEIHGQAMPNLLANQAGGGRGASYVPQGGEYYLVVNAIGPWSAKAVRIN